LFAFSRLSRKVKSREVTGLPSDHLYGLRVIVTCVLPLE
jgi:hypothetical protein